jgi:alanine racemase
MTARVVARINLAALERNCSLLLRASPRLCAVVKADAYGHGAVPCARSALAAGASSLAVASADEARELRAAGLSEPTIIVLGALTRAELGEALAERAEVVAWTDGFLDAVVGCGGGVVHVKLDTGMGRFGTRDGALADRLVARIEDSEGLELGGVMTHLATADEGDDRFLVEQLERFAAWVAPLREGRPDLLAHAENSAALLRAGRARFDMARCGVALYGLDPFGEDPGARGLEPVLELRSWVSALKLCAPGESAGYGRRFVATVPTELGLLPVGYADGVRRVLSGRAEALIESVRRPFVGTISMDSLTVDLGPHSGVTIGADAILIGATGEQRITAEDLARAADTINYEITCALSRRVPREHHRDGEPIPA